MRRRLSKAIATCAWMGAGCLTLIVACSHGTRDRMMHFFFEYPLLDDDSESLVSGDLRTARDVALGGPRTSVPVSRHRPFVERRCAVCHEPTRPFAPRPDQSTACRSCHADQFEELAYGHAPVLTGDCTVCHTMHVSRHDSLLRFSQPTLCRSCHEAEYEAEALTTYHRGIDGLDCTACHDPHASSLPMLLKPENDRAAARPGAPVGRSDGVN